MSGSRTATIDPRARPAYSVAEAARYLKLPTATLRAWTLGRPYRTSQGRRRFRPIFKPAQAAPLVLSFWNLIEGHVLRSLRADHAVSIDAVRQAVSYAERQLRIERLLLSPELRSDAGRLFLDRYGELINLSASGQLAMRQVMMAYLKRVEWDGLHLPIRLHPFLTGEAASSEMPIAIDPRVSFGRPVLVSHGVSTAIIAERLDAGESVAELAADYDLTVQDVQLAALYERAA